jgi:hypothetical protein
MNAASSMIAADAGIEVFVNELQLATQPILHN